VVTTGAIRRAKLQPNCHHQQTNIQIFTGRMSFLSPNQQCQSTEGKMTNCFRLFINQPISREGHPACKKLGVGGDDLTGALHDL